MPVLHYHPIIGGFEIFIKNICDRLKDKAEIFVVTGKVNNQPAFEQSAGLRIYRNASLFTLKDYSYSSYWYIFTMLPILFIKSWSLIKKEKIELLHAQGYFSGIICLLLKKLTGVPYLITIQSADFTVYHSEVKANFIVRWQDKLEKKVYREASICHAVSNDLVKHFANQGRTDAIMIPNGVETDIFKPIIWQEKNKIRNEIGIREKFVISCVSRLQEKNGTHDLISAIALLKKEGIAVECWIIGDGQERARLEKLVGELNIKDNIKFLGQILHEDAGKLVAATDLFVRPSLAEGFGIVYLEAFACGVPAIGTPVGGIPDFIVEGETGLICQVANPKDLAEKIKLLISNEELRNKIIANSFKLIKEKYSWDKIAQKIHNLYLENNQKNDQIKKWVSEFRVRNNWDSAKQRKVQEKEAKYIYNFFKKIALPNKNILEIGSGNGYLGAYLIELFSKNEKIKYTFSDLIPECVELCKKNTVLLKNDNIFYKVLDVYNPGNISGYNIIISTGYASAATYKEAVPILAKNIQSGAYLICDFVNHFSIFVFFQHPYNRLKQFIKYLLKKSDKKNYHFGKLGIKNYFGVYDLKLVKINSLRFRRNPFIAVFKKI